MTHRTKDGKEIQLENLEDSHLINIINFFIKRFEMSKMVILEDKKENKFYNKANNIKINKNMAYSFIDKFNETIPFYIYEALIRKIDINNQLIIIREIIERESKINIQFNFEENNNLINFEE